MNMIPEPKDEALSILRKDVASPRSKRVRQAFPTSSSIRDLAHFPGGEVRVLCVYRSDGSMLE